MNNRKRILKIQKTRLEQVPHGTCRGRIEWTSTSDMEEDVVLPPSKPGKKDMYFLPGGGLFLGTSGSGRAYSVLNGRDIDRIS